MQLQSCRNLRGCERMPPSDRTLPLPRSRDGTRLRFLRGRLLQPPAWCRMREVIAPPPFSFPFKQDPSFPKLKLFCSFPSTDASAIQWARRPRRATPSRDSVCAALGWRGDCATPAGRVSLGFHRGVAEVRHSASVLLILFNSPKGDLDSPPSPPPPLVCSVLSQPVTVTQWALFPCSVTTTAPAAVAEASWAISVTNVS